MRLFISSLFIFYSFYLLSDNYIVGYTSDGTNTDHATLWSATNKNPNGILAWSESQESTALAMTSYINSIYIVGYIGDISSNSNRAYIWQYDITTKKIINSKQLANTASCATGITYWLDGLWISGYEGASNSPTPVLYFIDSGLVSASQGLASLPSGYSGGELNSIFLYKGVLYCAATMINNNSNSLGGFYKIYYSQNNPGLNYDLTPMPTLYSADDLIVYNDTISVSGPDITRTNISLVASQLASPTTQKTFYLQTPSGLFLSDFNTSLTVAKNSIYISGTYTDNTSNDQLGVIGSFSIPQQTFSGRYIAQNFSITTFSFITSDTSGNLYVGGNYNPNGSSPLLQPSYYIIPPSTLSSAPFNTINPLPVPQQTSSVNTANAMLVNVLPLHAQMKFVFNQKRPIAFQKK